MGKRNKRQSSHAQIVFSYKAVSVKCERILGAVIEMLRNVELLDLLFKIKAETHLRDLKPVPRTLFPSNFEKMKQDYAKMYFVFIFCNRGKMFRSGKRVLQLLVWVFLHSVGGLYL